jgi:hypothetical protein
VEPCCDNIDNVNNDFDHHTNNHTNYRSNSNHNNDHDICRSNNNHNNAFTYHNSGPCSTQTSRHSSINKYDNHAAKTCTCATLHRPINHNNNHNNNNNCSAYDNYCTTCAFDYRTSG